MELYGFNLFIISYSGRVQKLFLEKAEKNQKNYAKVKLMY